MESPKRKLNKTVLDNQDESHYNEIVTSQNRFLQRSMTVNYECKSHALFEQRNVMNYVYTKYRSIHYSKTLNKLLIFQ